MKTNLPHIFQQIVHNAVASWIAIAMRVLLAAMLGIVMVTGARADPLPEQEPDIRVRIDGSAVIVNVALFVRATPEEAWAVMTDFDNASRFIAKLHESRILSRTPDVLMVSQKGTMGFGPFTVPLESVSEIRLKPYEAIQSRMLSGNMKKYDSDTTIRREADGSRITYRVESTPDVWIPPLIGPAMVEFETRSRFRQLVEEILRRKAAAAANK